MAPTTYRARVSQELLDRYSFDGKPRTRKEQLEITQAHALEMLNQMKGKPCMVRHGREGGHIIGSIKGSLINDSGEWWITAEVDDKTAKGRETIERIKRGELKGVSLTHDRGTREPIELSFVFEGARSGTHIVDEENPGPGEENPMETEELSVGVDLSNGGEEVSTETEGPSADIVSAALELYTDNLEPLSKRSNQSKTSKMSALDLGRLQSPSTGGKPSSSKKGTQSQSTKGAERTKPTSSKTKTPPARSSRASSSSRSSSSSSQRRSEHDRDAMDASDADEGSDHEHLTDAEVLARARRKLTLQRQEEDAHAKSLRVQRRLLKEKGGGKNRKQDSSHMSDSEDAKPSKPKKRQPKQDQDGDAAMSDDEEEKGQRLPAEPAKKKRARKSYDNDESQPQEEEEVDNEGDEGDEPLSESDKKSVVEKLGLDSAKEKTQLDEIMRKISAGQASSKEKEETLKLVETLMASRESALQQLVKLHKENAELAAQQAATMKKSRATFLNSIRELDATPKQVAELKKDLDSGKLDAALRHPVVQQAMNKAAAWDSESKARPQLDEDDDESMLVSAGKEEAEYSDPLATMLYGKDGSARKSSRPNKKKSSYRSYKEDRLRLLERENKLREIERKTSAAIEDLADFERERRSKSGSNKKNKSKKGKKDDMSDDSSAAEDSERERSRSRPRSRSRTKVRRSKDQDSDEDMTPAEERRSRQARKEKVDRKQKKKRAPRAGRRAEADDDEGTSSSDDGDETYDRKDASYADDRVEAGEEGPEAELSRLLATTVVDQTFRPPALTPSYDFAIGNAGLSTASGRKRGRAEE